MPLEEAAQAAKRGIWSGSFELPAKWRQSHPRSGSPAAAAAGAAAPAAVVAAAGTPVAAVPVAAGAAGAQAPPGCAIKGNITAKGEKIYHVPGAVPCSGHVFAAGLLWACGPEAQRIESQRATCRAAGPPCLPCVPSAFLASPDSTHPCPTAGGSFYGPRDWP